MNNLQWTTSSQFDGVREIALSQLEGFTEDQASRRAFTRRFFPVTVPLIVAYVVIFILGIRHAFDDLHFIIYWGITWLALGGVLFWQRKATPVSKLSGRPMIKLRRTDAPRGVSERIYVDPESHTYFRLVTMIWGHGHGGGHGG
jgi:hypothetical protein